VVCFSRDGLPDADRLLRVTSDNLEAANRLAGRGRTFVTLPLIGFETALAEGAEGEIERSVLDGEKVRPEDFRIAANPDLGSPGTRRAALLPVSLQIGVQGPCAELEFFLPKGCYATVILREYMKSATIIT